MSTPRPTLSQIRQPTVHADGFRHVSKEPAQWLDMTKAHGFVDITYKVAYEDMTAKITISRPELHNAFRPVTVNEMRRAMDLAQDDSGIGVIILTGEGSRAFCSGGDQNVRGEGGYDDGSEDTPRLRVLDLHVQMRRCPKPIIAMVAGYAIGGGHILHMVADLTIAADNAVFGQTGPKVGSFDAGYGSLHMARIVGQKKARELWFLCSFYSAKEALEMGLINAVVPLAELEQETMRWCRRIVSNSPTALSCLKAALNADEDGQAGIMQLAGNATRLFYLSEEGKEGKNAFLEKRKPQFRKLLSSRL
ncbi:unnamed protein product [Ascophyllum nodosum]